MDRLSEIRLVRGVANDSIPWQAWQERFSVLLKSGSADLYPEKLNVNLATRQEIMDFLTNRQLDPGNLTQATIKDQQADINGYADNAEEIANLLVPEEGPRFPWDKATLEQVLRDTLKDKIKPKIWKQVFSLHNQFYLVQITTAVNEVDARLEALVKVPRNNLRIGKNVTVLHLLLQ